MPVEIFQFLSKIQKSSIVSSLKNFIIKKGSFDEKFLYEEFVETQNYYINIGQPYFSFIEDYINDEKFLKDLRYCIKDLCFKLKQKELKKPILEKQKLYAKEQRKKIQEFKMKKEAPTKKQLSYYKSLCKNKDISPEDTKNLSKFDLCKLINNLLNET